MLWNLILIIIVCGIVFFENGFNVFLEVNVKKIVDYGVNGVVDKVRFGVKFVGYFGFGIEVFFEVFYYVFYYYYNEKW